MMHRGCGERGPAALGREELAAQYQKAADELGAEFEAASEASSQA